MKRISDLEKKYVLEALQNEFQTSLNSVFNSRLEEEFAEAFKRKFAIGHINGTATMHTALVALDVGPGEEVVVPPLTMSSTSIAVLHNQSVPVFADVSRDTFTIDPDSFERCITPKTRAIITVSLYGLSPDYDPIKEICKEKGIYLIEDNAQCLLGEYKGRLVGEFGEFASYSFQASKHMTSGEGGMLLVDDELFADRARKFNSLGYAGVGARKGKITRDDIQDPQYDRHVSLGFNYRMSEVTAAVALGQLQRLRELVDLRIRVAKLYDESLKGIDLFVRQAEPEGYKNSYWTYSLILKTEDPDREWYRFRDLFRGNGGDGYYAAWKLSYNEPLFQNEIQRLPGVWQKYDGSLCPNAEYLQPRMIQLKTNYWELAEAEQQAEILRKTALQFAKTRS